MNILVQGSKMDILGPFKCPECNCIFEIKPGEEHDYFRNNQTFDVYLELSCPNCKRRFTTKYSGIRSGQRA